MTDQIQLSVLAADGGATFSASARLDHGHRRQAPLVVPAFG
jgi:hypothetical protein